jgi:hypothetical protein
MIAETLTALGYENFYVNGDIYEGIVWEEEPETIPSKEEVESKWDAMITEKEAAKVAKEEAYQSALTKLSALGLTEEEVQAIIK